MYNILKYHGLIQPNEASAMWDPYSIIDNANSQTIIIFNIFSSRNILKNIIKYINSNFTLNFHRNHNKYKSICLKIVGYISCDSVKRNNNNNKSVTINK